MALRQILACLHRIVKNSRQNIYGKLKEKRNCVLSADNSYYGKMEERL